MSENGKIEFHDKRRIKSVDDICNDADEPDLERAPTYVEELMGRMETNDSRLKEYISAHKEKMAEMDKVRKRLEEDVDNRANARFGELICELFPLIDDFDRAIESAKGKSGDDPLLEGMVLLKDALLKVLMKQGLTMIDCLGEPFDPETAQAVATEQVDDDEKDNVVLEQLAPGFKFNERVLRPALVRVGRKA